MPDEDLKPLEDIFGDSEPTPATPETKEPEKQETAQEAAPAKEPAAATTDQPRDESGRFAPKAQPAEAAPVPPSPEPAPTQQAKPLIDPEQFKGYIEEREKRQAEKARADKLEAELNELRQQRQQTPVPSPLDDPDGYAAHMQEQRTRERIADRIGFSELMVRQSGKYEPADIDAAIEWGTEKAKSDPGFLQRVLANAHPVEWTIREHKRDQLMAQVGDDPDAWVLKRAAELAAAQGQQPPQAQQPASPQPAAVAASPEPPTRSLASAVSAGGIATVVDPGLTPLDQVFGS